MGEMGFGVDIREWLVGRPQAHLLISGAIADGRLRFDLRLHT